MILFKITNCPDKKQVGVYQHEALEMTLGNADADMIIDDPEINETQVKITHKNGTFYVANVNTSVEVRLNGERIGGKPMPFKSNDSLSMGGTTLFFTQINEKVVSMPPKNLNENVEARLSRARSAENSILRSMEFMAGEEESHPPVEAATDAPVEDSGPPQVPKRR